MAIKEYSTFVSRVFVCGVCAHEASFSWGLVCTDLSHQCRDFQEASETDTSIHLWA